MKIRIQVSGIQYMNTRFIDSWEFREPSPKKKKLSGMDTSFKRQSLEVQQWDLIGELHAVIITPLSN